MFLKKLLDKVSSMVTGIAGELVVNHIKLTLIGKAKTLDTRSFDNPEFYEKLENANREANMRPIGILNSTFSLISAIISAVSFVVVLANLNTFAPIVIIIAALPSAFVSLLYRNRNFRYIRFHSKERRQMQYYSSLMVNKDRVGEIKILGLGDTFTAKYKAAFAQYYKGLKKLYVDRFDSPEMVKLMVEHKFNINRRARNGETAFSISVRRRHIRSAEVLFNAGARFDSNELGQVSPEYRLRSWMEKKIMRKR
jgi:ABC-type multidrug transport system fused ATPase/permease subunit